MARRTPLTDYPIADAVAALLVPLVAIPEAYRWMLIASDLKASPERTAGVMFSAGITRSDATTLIAYGRGFNGAAPTTIYDATAATLAAAVQDELVDVYHRPIQAPAWTLLGLPPTTAGLDQPPLHVSNSPATGKHLRAHLDLVEHDLDVALARLGLTAGLAEDHA